ncbi:DUF968 domain-containing protein [Proteus terrae]|uniref:DUF968 domain-containing protein n=1 Tax=Proteus terrae TaxID=1574161 RepID=UPI000D694A28|nr:DUF968 domain-containing protein [Proteus terrae]
MKLLLTPYIQSDLGVVLLKPEAELFEQLKQHSRVIISDVPKSLNKWPSGELTENEQPLLNNKDIIGFLNNEKVIQAMGGLVSMNMWIGRNIHCCQINDEHDSYHHHELTTTWHKDGVIRTCWYHDNHIHNSSAGWVAELAYKNRIAWMIDTIRSRLRLDDSHSLTIPDFFAFAVMHKLVDKLPDAILRRILNWPDKTKERRVHGGFPEADIVPNEVTALSAMNARLDAIKPVINVTVDPEPPASFLLKPKMHRWENSQWLQWVKTQPCCVCGQQADDPHHIIGHGMGGMGTKAHDLFTIPLCRQHHDELHRDPKLWEANYGNQIELLFSFLNRSLGIGALV